MLNILYGMANYDKGEQSTLIWGMVFDIVDIVTIWVQATIDSCKS